MYEHARRVMEERGPDFERPALRETVAFHPSLQPNGSVSYDSDTASSIKHISQDRVFVRPKKKAIDSNPILQWFAGSLRHKPQRGETEIVGGSGSRPRKGFPASRSHLGVDQYGMSRRSLETLQRNASRISILDNEHIDFYYSRLAEERARRGMHHVQYEEQFSRSFISIDDGQIIDMNDSRGHILPSRHRHVQPEAHHNMITIAEASNLGQPHSFNHGPAEDLSPLAGPVRADSQHGDFEPVSRPDETVRPSKSEKSVKFAGSPPTQLSPQPAKPAMSATPLMENFMSRWGNPDEDDELDDLLEDQVRTNGQAGESYIAQEEVD